MKHTHSESYLFIPVPRPKKKEQESLGHPTLYLVFQPGKLYFFSEATQPNTHRLNILF